MLSSGVETICHTIASAFGSSPTLHSRGLRYYLAIKGFAEKTMGDLKTFTLAVPKSNTAESSSIEIDVSANICRNYNFPN